ncbi:MAG: OmpP1/FadL family transporter [Desulfovibrionaceae bacterium]
MVALAPSARAAGFSLYEWDTRATSMGGAVIASPDATPATIAYNPAAMTQLEGMQTSAGVTFIAPSAKLSTDGQDDVETKGKVYAAPNAYLTWQLNEDFWFGIGEFSRFGLGTNFDHNWWGANNVYKASVETISINPNLAYKVSDEFSVAAGAEIVFGQLDMRRNLSLAGPIEDIHMLPEGIAWTWNTALYWEPNDVVSIGLTYRKGFVFKGRGELDMSSSVFGDEAGDDEMTMTANFPGTVAGGIAFRATDELTLEFDAVYTHWSEFTDMEYDFSQKTLNSSVYLNDLNTTSLKEYSNSLRLQVGAEYEVTPGTFLRCGYVYDPSPQNPEHMDYMLPANNRQIASVGLGLKWDNLSLDFGYSYLWSQDYVIDNDVTGVIEPTNVSEGVTHIGGLNFSYAF